MAPPIQHGVSFTKIYGARVEFHINLLNIPLTCAYVKVESFEKDNYRYFF